MANDAFFAVTARDELADTMFFGGFKYEYRKSVVAGKKVYEFVCPEFTLKIVGRIITVNDKKFKHVADAKYHIQMEFVNA
jgi:hypothetical protein